MMKYIFVFLITVCFSPSAWVANDIAGVWINSDQDAHIKIFGSYGKYYGQVVWMKNPLDSTTGKPQLDKFNKDPNLQKRPILNLIVLSNLVYNAETQVWEDGTLYNPKTGDSYDAYCKMIDKNTLEFRFYMSVVALGKTANWKRIIP